MNPTSKFLFKHPDGRVEGPFPKPVVHRLKERFPGGSICSETDDHSRPENWILLSPSPAPKISQATESGPSRFWIAALALAAAALWTATSLKRGPLQRAPLPKSALSGPELAVEIFLPACGKTLSELAQGAVQIQNLKSGQWRLSWIDSQGRKSFDYTASDGSLRPLDGPSADLLNPRKKCPS